MAPVGSPSIRHLQHETTTTPAWSPTPHQLELMASLSSLNSLASEKQQLEAGWKFSTQQPAECRKVRFTLNNGIKAKILDLESLSLFLTSLEVVPEQKGRFYEQRPFFDLDRKTTKKGQNERG